MDSNLVLAPVLGRRYSQVSRSGRTVGRCKERSRGQGTPPPPDWPRQHNRPQACCRKGHPFQDPSVGSCLTLGSELSEESHVLTKQVIGKGRTDGEQQGEGTQENCSAT